MRRKLLTIIVAACATMACLDIGLRFGSQERVYQMAWPEIPALSRFTPDVSEVRTTAGDLGNLTPDAGDDETHEVETTIDSFGFRNDPGAALAPIDLVVLGDSFGFGVGTTQSKTFASLLRDQTGLATYNLSLPSSGPWAEFVNLGLEARHLHVRRGAVVLWVLFSGNDLDDTYGSLEIDQIPRTNSLTRAALTVRRLRNRSPLYQSIRRLRYAATRTEMPGTMHAVPRPFINGRTLLFAQHYVEARKRKYEDVVGHPNFPALRRTLAAGKELADKLGVTLKMVLIPSKDEVYGWLLDGQEPWSTPSAPTAFGTALGEVAASLGIPCLDLMPELVAGSKAVYAQSGQLLWWYDDTHWNEAGHRLAAAIINRDLLRH